MIDIILASMIVVLLIWKRKSMVDFFLTTRLPLFFWGVLFFLISGVITYFIETLLTFPIVRHMTYSLFSLFLLTGAFLLKEVSSKGFW
ncbi:MAG: hypothetical protein CL608_23440 [Anaerolineaceae bacterium]|nr:hypothetical protein [Anaerolineaceae bacterium]